MALTEIPTELSSTPGISDSSTSTAITIDSSGNVTFSGAVTATAATQSAGDNSTKIATTAYADAAAAAVVDSAPSTLDTLNELAAALGDDPNFATTVTNSIAAKAPIANPTFTGTATIPTADINGGNIDGTTIGGSTAAAGSFTTGSFTGNVQIKSGGKLQAFRSDNSRSILVYTDNDAATVESDTDPLKIKSADRIQFETGGANERMRIDSSGNVTINSSGTIPTGVLLGKQLVAGSSTGAEIIAVREDTSVAVGDKVGAFLIANTDTDGAEDHFVGMWGKVSSTNGSQNLHFAAGRSGYEGDSPQMTLDSGGKVGIGQNNPLAHVHIKTSTNTPLLLESTSGGGGYVEYRLGASGAVLGYLGSANELITSGSSSDLGIRAQGALVFATNGNTERLRINSAGYLKSNGGNGGLASATATYHELISNAPGFQLGIFNNKASGATNQYGLDLVLNGNAANTTNWLLRGGGPSTKRFFVYSNGDVKNTNNSYSAISDEKLKENIQDASSQWADIKALRLRKYSLKEEESSTPTQLGLIAQEVEAAGMSGLIYETPDISQGEGEPIVETGEVTKNLKYSVLYMKAVGALQEAIQRIETLEAEVAALKGE